jgi:hypothetical protein
LEVNDLGQDFSSWRNMETKSTVDARRLQCPHPQAASLSLEELQYVSPEELQHGSLHEDICISTWYFYFKNMTYFKWLF